MKILGIILGLLISSSIFAQKRDTFYVVSKKIIFKSAARADDRSMIEVDGKMYNGTLESIDQSAIESFDVMKPADAIVIFGNAGKNGAFLFKMTDKHKVEASNERLKKLINYISSCKPNKPLVIINHVIYNGGLNSIIASEIENVDILKAEYAVSCYGSKAKAGAVLISTTQKIDTAKGTFENHK